MQAFAAENGVDLTKSYFYADGDEDVALMYLVGNPRPTNPAGKMAAVARQTRLAGAAVHQPQRHRSHRHASRTLAGCGVDGADRGRRHRSGPADPQQAHAASTSSPSSFGRPLLAATGVNLNVLGKENLTAQRPAVFIFNHRNQASTRDRRQRWSATTSPSVGKKELESDPIVGTLGKMMDAAFIDRDDPKAAVEAPARRSRSLPARGLSILIAPEGTRLDTTEVGPVQEGPVPHRDVGGNPDRARS